MPPVAYAALIVALVSAFGGWKFHSWYDAAERAEYERGQAMALKGAADAIAKIDVRAVTISRQLETEIVEKPVYRDCRVPASGMLLVHRAYGGTESDAGKDGVPASGSPSSGGDIPRTGDVRVDGTGDTIP